MDRERRLSNSGTHRSALVIGVLALALLAAGLLPHPAHASPQVVSSFPAAGYNGVSPADPDLAVGPKYIVETINTAVFVYDRSGHRTSKRELGELFAPATNVFCADPRVIYWSWDKRYAIVCTDIGVNKTVRLAISKTSDPNLGWRTYDTGPNTDVDQPSVEATRDKLVIGGSTTLNGPEPRVAGTQHKRVVGASGARGTISASVFWVFQKSDLLQGVAHPRVKYLTTPRGQFTAVVQATPAWRAYFVQAYPGGNDLFLEQIWGTPASGVHTRINDLGPYPLVPPTRPAIPGGFLGGGYLDGRILTAVYETTSAGQKIIQYSGMAKCGSWDCNANGRITLSSSGPSSTFVNKLGESGIDGTYGAVSVNGGGRAIEVETRSSPQLAPQMAVVGDGFRNVVAAGTAGTTACNPGTDPPCDERWGDYLGATQDPANPKRLWFVGLHQVTSGVDGWKTTIASVNTAD
jgi:hypothetical protein